MIELSFPHFLFVASVLVWPGVAASTAAVPGLLTGIITAGVGVMTAESAAAAGAGAPTTAVAITGEK